jgi:hypothetical protein
MKDRFKVGDRIVRYHDVPNLWYSPHLWRQGIIYNPTRGQIMTISSIKEIAHPYRQYLEVEWFFCRGQYSENNWFAENFRKVD